MPEEKRRLVCLSNLVESGAAYAKIITHDNSAYFGGADTYFYSLDIKTGRKNWMYKTNGIIGSTAAIKDDTLYFGCFDENLYVLGTDGKLKWKFQTDGIVMSSPFIHKNTIYFGSSDHNLYAVDLKTQKELWRFRTNDEIIGDPLVHGNRIYIGSMDSYFYCLDLNGNLIWKFKTGDSIITGAPALSENMIYFGSGDCIQYGLTLDGNLVWKFVTGETIYNISQIYEDAIYFGSSDRYVYALDKKIGICKWKFMTGAGIPAPVVFKGRIYVLSDKLYCFTLGGHKIWEFNTSTLGVGMLNVNEDGCFFGAMDGKAYRVSLDGTLIWDFRLNGVLPSLSMLKGVVPPPKWNPNRFDEDTGMPVGPFNPYTLLKEGDELKKYISGIDTTVEPYVGIPRDIGAYRDAGMGSVNAYRPKESGKKKRDLLEELLERQQREHTH